MNTASDTLINNNPFPGLRPFAEGEEHLFFGRESQTDTLVDRLRNTRFLAVIGSSGSGKSSLVNCGLLTALRGGLMADAGTTWRVAQCRPSGQPIASLTQALANCDGLFENFSSSALKLEDVIDSNLRMSDNGLVDVYHLSRQAAGTNLLLVVDQFEELFRYNFASNRNKDETDPIGPEATQFVKLLLNACENRQHSIYIVITMRSDFLGDCTRFEGLAEAINRGQFLVPRMSRTERKLAISGPVEVSGASIDSVLLTRLINDLGNDPDQLSILQHALNRIWARWEKLKQPEEALNLSHYSAVGSMKLALNQHADQAYGELTTERQRTLCEKLFKSLTNKATDPRGVRRPTQMKVLCAITDSTHAELSGVIDVFRKPSRSFLMPPITQPLLPDTVIDISHESLMRMWKLLVKWADEEAESTRIFHRLASTAKLHADGLAGLWRDPDLQLALEWRMQNEPNEQWAENIAPGFNQAMIFLDESRAASDEEAEKAMQLAEQERELQRSRAVTAEQEKRILAQNTAARRQRYISVLIAGGLLMTSLLSFFAMQRHTHAQGRLDAIASLVPELRIATIQTQSLNKSLNNLRDDNQQILATTLSLLEKQKILIFEQMVVHQFTNLSSTDVLLLKLNDKGYEHDPTLIPTGKTVGVAGFNNQIWIARSVPTGSIHATGFLDSQNTNTSL